MINQLVERFILFLFFIQASTGKNQEAQTMLRLIHIGHEIKD